MPSRIRSENVSGGRKHYYQVKASTHEAAALEVLASRAKKTVPRLMREAALAQGGADRIALEQEVKDELTAVRNLVRALGNNMNQLAKHANSTGEFPTEATTAVRSVQRAALRINEILAKLEGS